jgi:hypothetical protein
VRMLVLFGETFLTFPNTHIYVHTRTHAHIIPLKHTYIHTHINIHIHIHTYHSSRGESGLVGGRRCLEAAWRVHLFCTDTGVWIHGSRLPAGPVNEVECIMYACLSMTFRKHNAWVCRMLVRSLLYVSDTLCARGSGARILVHVHEPVASVLVC